MTLHRGYHSACLLMLVLMAPLTSRAHLPALYGWEFLASGEDDKARGSGCSADDSIPTPSPDDRLYREQIESLEREQGAYGADMVEWLGDLGRHYRNRGDYGESVRVFTRALHLVRIHHGLDSEQQLALLDELAATYRLQGDLAALDAVQSRRFTLLGGDVPSLTEQSIAANLDYMQWQREAYGWQIDGDPRRRLLELYLLNQRLIDDMKEGAGEHPEPYRQLLLSQLSNLYLIMGDDFMEAGSASVGSSTELHPSQASSPAYVRQRLAKIQAVGVDRGVDLLDELSRLAPAGDTVNRAAIHLELGDWYQWNGDSHRARQQYTRVEVMLERLNERERLESWLGQPVELPGNPEFRQFNSESTPFEPGAVVARFQVNARGLAENLEVLAVPEEFPSNGNRLKRMLSETHFRPRFVGGRPVAAGVAARQYRFVARAGETAAECTPSALSFIEASL